MLKTVQARTIAASFSWLPAMVWQLLPRRACRGGAGGPGGRAYEGLAILQHRLGCAAQGACSNWTCVLGMPALH